MIEVLAFGEVVIGAFIGLSTPCSNKWGKDCIWWGPDTRYSGPKYRAGKFALIALIGVQQMHT